MDKDNDTETDQQKSTDKLKQGEKKDNLILAGFKKILGLNYHQMGTKKDF